jgi:PST family polysaccharide transporter
MALFTGLQGFTIICSIVKMKLAAMWMQAVGVGLLGIFNITTDTISNLTDLGLRQSSVRDVALHGKERGRLALIVAVVRRWCRCSGLLGAVVVSGLCVPLSLWFFKTPGQWWQFALLSVTLLLNAIAGGEQAILQGTSALRPLAKISFLGSLLGLIISVPIFYFMGSDGALYSVIAYSVTVMGATLFYRYRGPVEKNVKRKEFVREGRGFVTLGAYMAVAACVSNLAQMAFIAFLSRESTGEEVGLFQAGSTIVVRYVGMIFSAVGMEYYPRLAANVFSRKRISTFVNHEITLLLLVLTPVVLLFLLLRVYVVRILYAPEFDPIIPFISFAILSYVFKAVSWCMAFVVLARGDGRIFILTESVDAVIGLSLSVVCYKIGGLAAVGVAYILWYLCYTAIVWSVYRVRYGLRLSRRTMGIIAVALAVSAAGWYCMEYMPPLVGWIALPIASLVFLPPLMRLWHRK